MKSLGYDRLRKSLRDAISFLLENKLALCVALYLVFNCILRFAASDVLEGDQAEQLLAAQEWAAGYQVQPSTTQPPLYTYLLILSRWMLSGNSYLALLLVRIALLVAAVGAFSALCNHLRLSTNQKIIAFSSAAMMPPLIWEVQRDLTHTLLGISLSLLLSLAILRLRPESSLKSYIALGLLVGLGALAKYTVIVVFISLGIASLCFASRRPTFCSWKIGATIAAIFLVIVAHLTWISNFLGDRGDVLLSKINPSPHYDLAYQLLSSIFALISFAGLSIFAIAGLLIFYRSVYVKNLSSLCLRRPCDRGPKLTDAVFLLISTLIGVILFIAFVAMAHGTTFKDRWLTLLLITVPVLIGYFWKDEWSVLSKAYCTSGFVCALAASTALALRPFLPPELTGPMAIHLPVKSIVKVLKKDAVHPDYIVSSSIVLGGNLLSWFPSSFVESKIRSSQYCMHPGPDERCREVLFIEKDRKKLVNNLRAFTRGALSPSCTVKIPVQSARFTSDINKNVVTTVYWVVLSAKGCKAV